MGEIIDTLNNNTGDPEQCLTVDELFITELHQ